jgi:hypothetical protein
MSGTGHRPPARDEPQYGRTALSLGGRPGHVRDGTGLLVDPFAERIAGLLALDATFRATVVRECL